MDGARLRQCSDTMVIDLYGHQSTRDLPTLVKSHCRPASAESLATAALDCNTAGKISNDEFGRKAINMNILNITNS